MGQHYPNEWGRYSTVKSGQEGLWQIGKMPIAQDRGWKTHGVTVDLEGAVRFTAAAERLYSSTPWAQDTPVRQSSLGTSNSRHQESEDGCLDGFRAVSSDVSVSTLML